MENVSCKGLSALFFEESYGTALKREMVALFNPAVISEEKVKQFVEADEYCTDIMVLDKKRYDAFFGRMQAEKKPEIADNHLYVISCRVELANGNITNVNVKVKNDDVGAAGKLAEKYLLGDFNKHMPDALRIVDVINVCCNESDYFICEG